MNSRRRMLAPSLWAKHHIGSSDCFDRGRNQLRYCNMRCWPMSALAHKRTNAAHKPMSALPPKADMCSAQADVR